MVAVIQQVKHAKLWVENKLISSIGEGAVIFVGVHKNDTLQDAEILAEKIFKARIFKDENNKINLNFVTAKKQIMLVSNFTLLADMSHGTRPNFSFSADKELALALYQAVATFLEKLGIDKVQMGAFGEYMEIETKLDGPINIVIDTHIFK